jgi:hypothetical protein
MKHFSNGLRSAAISLCLTAAWLCATPLWGGAEAASGTTASPGVAPTRHYLIGVYAGPGDDSTPALMGYPWDYTIGRSYQDPCAGCGVSGLTYLHGYPVIIDLYHVQPSYPKFDVAAAGGYDTLYRQTVASLIPYANEIYAVRIDSEFNGSWSASTPFKGWQPVSSATWIAGFRRLALIVRQALPNAKIIWNPNIGQNDPFPYYPGDDVVDLIGPDMYCNPAHYASPARCWNDFLSGANGVNLDAFASFAQQHHKSLAIPEWADLFGDGVFIQDVQQWADQHDVVAQSYWDSGDALETTASLPALKGDQEAYVQAFGHRPYAGTFWGAIKPIPPAASAQ